MVRVILSILSGALSIYTLICFVYIIMSWFPLARRTKFGQVISSLAEPYLNFFSRWKFLTIGRIDFSPILSIGLLSVASSILGGIQTTGKIWFGHILATIINMLWSIVSTLLTVFIILLLVRWIVLKVNHGATSVNSAWNQIDQMISSIVFRISRTFTKKQSNYQTSLLISWITLLILKIAITLVINMLINLCLRIPF